MTVDLDDGLVLYLPFNDGAGISARDDSGKANTGSLQNMDNSNWVGGKSGGALYFNGIDEHVNCGHNTSLDLTDGFTVSAWVNPNNVTGWSTICAKLGATNDTSAMYMYIYNGIIGFRLYHGASSTTAAGGLVSIGQWHHVVATFNGDRIEVFVDNISVGSIDNTFTINVVTNDLWAGDNERWAGENFHGTIDELRIYNRAFPLDEIKWLYNNPSGTVDNVPSGRACFTDLNGIGHTISDMISLDVDSVLSDAADGFSMGLLNTDNRYSWLERGCEIEILIGMGGINEKKLTGFVLEMSRTLDSNDIPLISISGEDWGNRLNHLYFSGRFYDKELSAVLKTVLDSTDPTTGKSWREIAGLSSDYSHIDETIYYADILSYVWQSLSGMIKTLAAASGSDWYVDVDKKLHLFNASSSAIAATITDSDLVAAPVLSDVGDIVNRSIVVGGYDQRVDQESTSRTSTRTVTDTVTREMSFTPEQDYLSSILLWTQLIGGSESGITISMQRGSGFGPDGINMPNGKLEVTQDGITDGGYTEFRFPSHVTLTPGDMYWLVIAGTDSTGQKIGVGEFVNVTYETRWPSRIVIMAGDSISQTKYGICMQAPYVDDKLEDPNTAEQIANENLELTSRKVADISRHGADIDSGDVVQLTLTTLGIAVDATMKVMSSSWHIGERFIDNKLKLEEI